MKKYVKPELFFESFELSQSIAACGIDVHHANTTDCDPTLDSEFWGGYADPVFSGDKAWCTTDISAIESYCYTVGTSEAGRLFNS